MLGESLAIIAVILVLAAMLARAGRHVFAAFTLPLISIPVFHVLRLLTGRADWHIPAVWVGFAVGLCLCVLFSRAFRARKSRIGYLLFCVLFLVALLIAYQL